jgi:hypothetical protein
MIRMFLEYVTHEGIGRPGRVKPKRDVNGLEGRVKPSTHGTCWLEVIFGLLRISYLPGSMPAEAGREKSPCVRGIQSL